MGPPKQAEKAIIGNPILATVTSATKSLKEFPIAKIVTPKIASLTPKMAPKARRTPTTSSAIVEIQAIATTKPTAHRALCHDGGLSGDEKVNSKAKVTKPTTRAYNNGTNNSSSSSPTVSMQKYKRMEGQGGEEQGGGGKHTENDEC